MTHLEKRLGILEEKFSGLEASIAGIMSEVCELKNHFARQGKLHRTDECTGLSCARVEAATSTPSEWRQCGPVQSGGDDAADVGTHGNPQDPRSNTEIPLAIGDGARGASFSRPLIVQDDASSRSADSNKKGVGPSTAVDSPARRVHANPRIRAIPFQIRLAVAPPCSPTTTTVVGPSNATPTRVPKYRDPPGYDDVADFGCSSEPKYELPVLKPRKHPVRVSNLCRHFL